MVRLSVIIPIYNAEKFLPLCLDSMTKQTVFADMELILVDDGSKDGSAEICDAFAAEHPNTVVVHQPNGGVSRARNAGIEKAQGRYIGFCDADDTLDKDYYEKLLLAAEQTDSDFSFCGMTFDRTEGKREQPLFFPSATVVENEEIVAKFARKMLTDGQQNSVCCKVIRRNLIMENHVRFPTDIRIGEDKIFVLSLLKFCRRIVSVDSKGYYYRDVGSSAMHSNKKMEVLLSTDEIEMNLFTSLGLDFDTVRCEKSVFLFTELADFLQRELQVSCKRAKLSIRENFGCDELMKKIDFAVPFVQANYGKIYSLLAAAFQKRSMTRTMAVL
ncbi:MAG TPA: hypothetical protein DDY98_09435, partial [Ruminococcaceae bacterium]|nr:hypothetical protein [Oscillospiraceae bacterium]